MRRVLVLISFLLMCNASFSQKIISKIFDSKELKSSRELKIYIPKGYDKDSVSNFPLAIIIDSDYLFDNYVANAKLFAMTDKAPEQIVVGININKTRKRDTNFDENTFRLTPSNIKFAKFIMDEVLPYMEGSYKTSPFVTLVGQGAGANLVVEFLKEREPLFNAYLAINPKFPPNTLAKLKAFEINKYGKLDNTFYLYINDVTFFSKAKKKIALEIKTYMSSLDAKNFNFVFDEMNSPNYISAISEALPRAMSKVFESYAAITKEEFDTKIKNLEPSDAISYLENKYLDIDFLFGANLGIREKDIFIIEDVIIDKEEGEYLRDFGEMILNVYPKSHIGDYYVGLWYEKKGKMKMALESYRSGYGKMSNSDPNKDLFYTNIERVSAQ